MKTENTSSLTDVDACFQKLNSIDMPILLLLDEVQHLATKKDFSPFTKALRSFMTARGDNKIKGLFTGSNQNGLQRLFRDTKAPFFESASGIVFKELGEDFVKHQLKNYKLSTGDEVDYERALEYFHEHHCKPGPLTSLLRKMAAHRVTDIDYALDNIIVDFLDSDNELSVEDLLNRSTSDFGILYLLAIGQADSLFSEKTLSKLELLGLSEPEGKLTVSELGNAKARLLRDNLIINPERSVYNLESPELADVVLEAFKARFAQ